MEYIAVGEPLIQASGATSLTRQRTHTQRAPDTCGAKRATSLTRHAAPYHQAFLAEHCAVPGDVIISKAAWRHVEAGAPDGGAFFHATAVPGKDIGVR